MFPQFPGAKAIRHLAPDTVSEYEALLDENLSPVSVISDHDGETSLGPDQLGDPHTLFLAVDLAYPQDVLLWLMQLALREAVSERGTYLKRDGRKRQRADKADADLAVYDLVLNGETFGTIARKVNRPVSSVKSAYLAACQNIFGSAPPPRKRGAPLFGFENPGTHVENCKACKAAGRPEEMCAQARSFYSQDHVSQRERPAGRDPRDLSE